METLTTKRCTGCSETKPLDEFGPDARTRDGRQGRCRACDRERVRQYQQANPEQVRDRLRQYRETHREQLREGARQRREDAEYQEYQRQYQRRYREDLRIQVFDHYGWACVCCGSSEDLTIDHVNGDGREHRLEVLGNDRTAGHKIYYWLIGNGFPEGFQTLCRLCNDSKKDGDRCRLNHETKV